MSKIVGVHIAGKHSYSVLKEDARKMVEDKIAKWIPGSLAIEIIQAKHSDGNSHVKPGNRTTERYAEGHAATRAAVDGRKWTPITNVIVKDRSIRVVPSAYGALRKTGDDAVFPIFTREWETIDKSENATRLTPRPTRLVS